jgi:hypothetical protein
MADIQAPPEQLVATTRASEFLTVKPAEPTPGTTLQQTKN